MRQLAAAISLALCLGISACSSSSPDQAVGTAKSTAKSAAKSAADSAGEAVIVAVQDQGAESVGTDKLTRVTINGKEIDPKHLPAEVREKLLAAGSESRSAEASARPKEVHMLSDDQRPREAVVIGEKKAGQFAAQLAAAAAKQGKSEGDRIQLPDDGIPEEVKRQLDLAVAQARSEEARSAERRAGTAFPAKALTLLDGSHLDLIGKPSVVTIWASWCKPCIAEMPLFERLARERGDLQVAALNVDFSIDDMNQVLSKNAFELNLAYDEGMALHAALGVNTLPLTLVLDANGVIRHQNIGSAPNYEKLLEVLKLNDQSPAVAAAP